MITPAFSTNFLFASLDSRVNLTRAGATATRVTSNGLIETIAADAPRFDYNPVTLACKGLLIEEQRTNLLAYSEQFENSAWGKTAVTATANAIISPDGNVNADKLVENTSASAHGVNQNFMLVAGATYVLSVYAKLAERTCFTLGGGSLIYGFFNLSTGVATKGIGNVNTTVVSATAINAGSGWYRCVVVFTRLNTNLATGPEIFLSNTTTPATGGRISYTGDGASGIYIWGAQLEAATLATSYIPTTAAAVTRNADIATITGTNFSGFWRSGPGSLLVRALPSTVSGTRPLVQVDDATADNIIALRGNTTNPELYIRAGGSDQATIDAGTILVDAQGRPLPYRLAGAWQAGSAAASLNSGLAVNGAPASIPAVTQMRLGSDGTNYLNGHLQAVQYWPVRLSNASLQNASSTAGYQSIIHPVSRDTIISEPV